MGNVTSNTMLAATLAGGTESGKKFNMSTPNTTFYANGATSGGAGTLVVDIEATNMEPSETDGIPDVTTEWVNLGTINLTLSTTIASDGFAINAPWKYVRAIVTAVTGTGAAGDIIMSHAT